MFLPLLIPLLAYAFTGIGETLTRSIFGSGAVIAFGKRVFLFLAIRSFSQDMLTDPLLKLLGKFVLIPVGALYALGLLDMVAARLEATVVPLGNLSFNLLWLIQFFVVGGVIFWLGRWSNDQSSGFINKHEEMRPHPPTGQQGNRDCHFRRGLFDPDEHHGDFSDLACRTGGRGWCWPWLWFAEDCIKLYLGRDPLVRGASNRWGICRT
jgi:hypothetical protein